MINSNRARSGLTLIELLFAISLSSLVAMVAASRLAGTGVETRVRGAARDLSDLDGRARLFSRTFGPATLLLRGDHRTLDVQSQTGDSLASLLLPKGVKVWIETDDNASAIRFDRLGRSPDYALHVGTPTRLRTLEVSGLTGYVQVLRPRND